MLKPHKILYLVSDFNNAVEEDEYRCVTWPMPCHVSDRAVWRYVQRFAGDKVDARQIAEFVEEAARQGSAMVRAHSLGRVLPAIAAPVPGGVLLGHVTRVTGDRQGTQARRTKKTVESRHLAPNDFPMGAAWRTFLSRDMLSGSQRSALSRIEPALRRLRQAEDESDERVAGMWPFPDEVPADCFRSVLEASTELLEALRGTDLGNFSPVGWEAYSHFQFGRLELERVREAFWPGSINREVSGMSADPDLLDKAIRSGPPASPTPDLRRALATGYGFTDQDARLADSIRGG